MSKSGLQRLDRNSLGLLRKSFDIQFGLLAAALENPHLTPVWTQLSKMEGEIDTILGNTYDDQFYYFPIDFVGKLKGFIIKILLRRKSMPASEGKVGETYLSKKNREVKIVKIKGNQITVELVGQGSQAIVPPNYELTPIAPKRQQPR